MDSLPSSKKCSRCGETKALTEFHRDKTKPDGAASRCRLCVSEAGREWRLAHPEEVRESKRVYYRANREEVRARSREYYYLNHEYCRARQNAYIAVNVELNRQRAREWYHANKERACEASKAWKKKNPDRVLANHHVRKAKLRNVPSERILLSILIERDGGHCQICGKAKGAQRWSIDHILPLSQGGHTTYANTRLAHFNCNARRQDKGAAQLRMIG